MKTNNVVTKKIMFNDNYGLTQAVLEKELIIKVFDHEGEVLCVIHIEGATMAQEMSAITKIQRHDEVGWISLEGSMSRLCFT